MNRLITYANECIAKYPQHKDEIKEIVQLCKDEIEEGSSVEHEVDLAIGSIEDLIKESTNEQ